MHTYVPMTIAVHHGRSKPICKLSRPACTHAPGNEDTRPRLLSVGSTADVATSTTAFAVSNGALNVRSSS